MGHYLLLPLTQGVATLAAQGDARHTVGWLRFCTGALPAHSASCMHALLATSALLFCRLPLHAWLWGPVRQPAATKAGWLPMVPRALQPGEDRIATRQSAKVGDFGLANSCKRQTLPLHAACKACVPCWAPGTGVAAAPACANTSAQPWCNCSQLCHLQLLDQSVMSGSPSPVLCGSPAPQWTAQHRSEQRP